MIPDSHRDILEKKGFAHVATIGPDGEPHSSPVWYDWDGEHFLFSQTKTRQKYRNVQRDPRVAVSMTDPDNPYRYLEIRGTVDGIDEDEGNVFINSMAKKYMDEDVYPWHQPEDERIVVKVRPERTTSMG
ncbi:MAG TPA: PPOX class F420-dependent oxidoreductase [Acidimicrobiales bacterium]|nr:PPOX class F420-dependent oxidoreductase [Acidimicrobiales bacterium]